jgi:type VI secretion system protein VasI
MKLVPRAEPNARRSEVVNYRVFCLACLAVLLAHFPFPSAVAGYPDADATVEVLEGGWELYRAKDRMDDSNVVMLGRLADQTIDKRFGREATPTLFIQCRRNRTGVAIIFGDFLSTRDLPVEWRIDRQSAVSQKWAIASDHKGLWAPSPIPFARQLARGNQLLFEVTPYARPTIQLTFTLTGLESAIASIASTCRWPPR